MWNSCVKNCGFVSLPLSLHHRVPFKAAKSHPETRRKVADPWAEKLRAAQRRKSVWSRTKKKNLRRGEKYRDDVDEAGVFKSKRSGQDDGITEESAEVVAAGETLQSSRGGESAHRAASLRPLRFLRHLSAALILRQQLRLSLIANLIPKTPLHHLRKMDVQFLLILFRCDN